MPKVVQVRLSSTAVPVLTSRLLDNFWATYYLTITSPLLYFLSWLHILYYKTKLIKSPPKITRAMRWASKSGNKMETNPHVGFCIPTWSYASIDASTSHVRCSELTLLSYSKKYYNSKRHGLYTCV